MTRLLDLLLDLFAILGGAVSGLFAALISLWIYWDKVHWMLHPPKPSGLGAIAGGVFPALQFGALPGAVVALLLVVRRRRKVTR